MRAIVLIRRTSSPPSPLATFSPIPPGWPCWEGPIHTPQYDWGTGPGLAICPTITMTLPAFSYEHPVPPIAQWSGNIASISGLAGLGTRIYYNDMTVGVIRSIDAATYGGDTLVATNVYPVE